MGVASLLQAWRLHSTKGEGLEWAKPTLPSPNVGVITRPRKASHGVGTTKRGSAERDTVMTSAAPTWPRAIITPRPLWGRRTLIGTIRMYVGTYPGAYIKRDYLSTCSDKRGTT